MSRYSQRIGTASTTSDFDSTTNGFRTVSYVIYGFSALTVFLTIIAIIKIVRFHKRNNTWLYQYLRRGRMPGTLIVPMQGVPMNAAAGTTVMMAQYPFPMPGMQPYPGMGMTPQQGAFAMPMGAGVGGNEGQQAQDTGNPGYIPPGGYFPPSNQAYTVGMQMGQMDPNQYAAAMMQNPQFVAAMQSAQYAAAMQAPQSAWGQPAAFPPAGVDSSVFKR